MPRYWSQRGSVYSPEERARLILDYYAAMKRGEDGDPAAPAAMASVIEQYEAATPIVSLSRCPFTGEVFETSLDLFGIDGMWWAYNHNYRPYVAPIASYFAWTGALSFDGRLPVIPLQAMVGPAVPFVLPRILEHPNLRAVVSSQLVGEHVGFPVVYFAQPTPHDLERVDDWGHSFHLFLREDGSPTTATSTEYDPDKDFDLAPWIEAGKLSWIAPGDLDLKLHGELDDCPFVDLPGVRQRQYLQNGELWTADDRDFLAR